jgi:hypothetical protein
MTDKKDRSKAPSSMSHGSERKWLGRVPLFDPSEGWVVRQPPGEGKGNWAGAPSAFFDEEAGRFFLSYRLRKPLTEGRGYLTCVAESKDGREFTDIWSGKATQFNSPSIERSCLIKTPEGRYRLYVSYVEAADNRWRIDMLEADHPANFDPARRQAVLHPDDVNSEGVKDPYIILIGGMYYMYVPYGPKTTVTPGSSAKALHGTGNIFTTGLVAHPTGLAVSVDGIHFEWKGDVIRPGEGWDRNVARLACVVYVPPVFTAFYDGRTGQGDVYEDRTGVAMGLTPDRFESLSRKEPVLSSPWGTGSLRYMDIVPVADRFYYYYEQCRPDGAHELRGNVVEIGG